MSAAQPERPLLPHHQALLDASAISSEVAAARGYWSATERNQLDRLFGATQSKLVPALVVPIFDVRGEAAFSQLRPDSPRVLDGRPRKYEIPSKVRMAIDVPPSVQPVLGNPSVPLVFTEGARKADAGVSAGLYCIDLIGVYAWRGRNDEGGLTALADFEWIACNDRDVYLAFDSDAMTNTSVHAALVRLRGLLQARGAHVRIIYLPSGDGGVKTGLDDFLAAGHNRDDVLACASDDLRPLAGDTSLPQQAPAEPVAPRALTEVLATFRRWMHLPDQGALLAMLGALAANMLDGDPVWLLLVGPPSGGKSELLQATTRVPIVHRAATLTEGALLSGTAARDHAAGAKGGLLKAIGPFGVLMLKDFGSVLSMQRDSRASLLAALREIYDGDWTRHLGTDGGKTLHWEGKLGLLAGCTPTIDRHHAVMGAMGERFLLYRLPVADAGRQAASALKHDGREVDMRRELGDAVAGLFAGELTAPAPPTTAEQQRLIALSTFVARSRSAVERDGYSREVELVSEPESPARLVLTFARMLAGLVAIGVARPEAWRVVTKIALDSMPALRLAAIQVLYAAPADIETGKVAEEVRYPTSTTRRVLEDLDAHRVAARSRHGQGHSDTWQLSDWARSSYRGIEALQTVPEMSGDTQSTVNGTVPEMSGEEHTSSSTPSPPPTFDVPLPVSAQADISGTVPPPSTNGAADHAPHRPAPVNCAYPERHLAAHRPHPETGLVVCQVCYPTPDYTPPPERQRQA